MSQLMTNFSRERFNHLKEVVHHLRPVSNPPQQQSTLSQPSSYTPRQMENHRKPHVQQAQYNSYEEQKRQDQRNGNFRGAKIAAGTVIGGAVGGTIAGVVGGSVIMGVVGGAVAVGAVVAITTNGE